MSTRLTRWVAAATTALLAAGGLALATPAQAAPAAAPSEHQRIVDFWTPDKVAKARPRDFTYDAASGTFKLNAPLVAKGKPVKPSGVLGADWNGGGLVQQATGKILFAMGGSYYVCSGSVAKDSDTGTSVILTAGHCVYDNAGQAFATNWMFIPNYDATPLSLDTAGSFCAQTTYGCWTAQALVASSVFTGQTAFTTTATLYDYAFATVGAGGRSGTAQLDATVGAQAISFARGTSGATTDLFGYPAEKPWDGKRLIYSENTLGFDARNGNNTYRVASNMTGGCSGGPWFQGFSAGTGTMMSVNSYGYGGRDLYLQGPVLNSETQGMYARAQGATGTIRY